MMEDLMKVSDDLAEKADRAGNEAAEKVLSRIQVELSEDFKEDLVDDYLRLAQLLDPRVCHRTMPFTGSEIDRLLRLLLKYLPDTDEGEDVSEVEDAFDTPRADFTSEFNAFKAHMRKVQVKVIGAQDEADSYKYYGGVHRREDVNVFTFYQDLLPQIPNLSIGIRTILAHQPCTVDNERIFNIAGHVISLRRCRLTPERAEMLILSAFRYRGRSRSKQPPRLPSFATAFDSKDVVLIAEDDEEDDVEVARQLAEDWDIWGGWEEE
jgi:hypothetical protein